MVDSPLVEAGASEAEAGAAKATAAEAEANKPAKQQNISGFSVCTAAKKCLMETSLQDFNSQCPGPLMCKRRKAPPKARKQAKEAKQKRQPQEIQRQLEKVRWDRKVERKRTELLKKALDTVLKANEGQEEELSAERNKVQQLQRELKKELNKVGQLWLQNTLLVDKEAAAKRELNAERNKVQQLLQELSENEASVKCRLNKERQLRRQHSVLAQREAVAKKELNAKRFEVQQLLQEIHVLEEREAAAVWEKEEAMMQALEGPGLPDYRWTACAVYMQAQTILDSLGIDSKLFERKYDRCYCPACYKRSYPDTIMNDSPVPYVVPRGWVRFGLKLPAHSIAMGVMEKWCVSFHGNSPEVLKSIIATGGFLFPGDVMPEGRVLQSSRCAGRTDQCVYTSPTANYSGLGFYATPTKGPGNMLYQAIIQCRQKPDSFKEQAETMLFRSTWPGMELCPHVSVNSIEWMTNWRNTLVPYGLLIRAFPPGSPPKHFKSPVDPPDMLS